jgi:glycosyltransferase involved in cell wall biosynthesis
VPSRAVFALIDLSGLSHPGARAALADLSRVDRLGLVAGRALVLLPAGCAVDDSGPWSVLSGHDGLNACQWAFEMAAQDDAALLVVAGGALPTAELVSLLLESADLDPLFGIAVPRFVNPSSGRLMLLNQFGPSPDTAPLRVLAALPDYQVVTECVAPVMLVRRELVGSLSPGWPGPDGLWPGLVEYAVRARRAGFRTVICNRAAADLDPATAQVWGCQPGTLRSIRQAWPDLVRVETEHELSPQRSAERLLAAALERPRSLLLDARNLTPVFNGTSTVILQICDALHRLRADPEVTLWVHRDVESQYGLAQRYSGWRVCTTQPSERFAAGLRLSQPWYHAELDGLSRLAAVNSCWMLDTIAWDVVYCAPPDLDAVWQRLAVEFDGVFFISEFSRERFANRFSVGPGVHLSACPLSLDAADYIGPVAAVAKQPPYWLVVGNRYDHKHVGPTVDLLSRAFPGQHLTVFGDRDQPRTARVTRFDSGAVESDIIQACYAHADAVIFPSFYEGFGLPIVQGLAHDRTVVARRSPLVDELTARYRGPGRLVTFDSDRSLVETLERLSRGQPLESVALTRDRRDVWTWDSAAALLLSEIERLVDAVPSAQMRSRTGLTRGLTHPYRRA